MSDLIPSSADEWLEADGFGGFACGTVAGERTRRYHALLLAAVTPPTSRFVLVNGIDAWLERCTQAAQPGLAPDRVPLSVQRYAPDVLVPPAPAPLREFTRTPWPTWTFGLPDNGTLRYEIWVSKRTSETILRWSLVGGEPGAWRLQVRPLLSGRDYHALHHENAGFDFSAAVSGGNVCWHPYPGVPAIAMLSNGCYTHEPDWYRNFLYAAERERGLDDLEDLATPGRFAFDLSRGAALLVLRSGSALNVDTPSYVALLEAAERERRRSLGNATAHGAHPGEVPSTAKAQANGMAGLSPALALAADSYVVARAHGRTLLAGFPWFTDWGRDTFIALRGLALATGRLELAEAILLEWAGTVSEGMLPNRFTDGGPAEYNSVDASLWFIVAAYELLTLDREGSRCAPGTHERLAQTVDAILAGYAQGTRYRIGAAPDGLLAAGVPGVQLTWMDAKTGDHVVTPRIGKPVEVQALWINALACGARLPAPQASRWSALEMRARQSFLARFINPASGGLYDVVDVDHVALALDASVRPNQIFAVGGLPFRLLDRLSALPVVDQVERTLLTPLGLRSLAPGEPEYVGRYAGSPTARDGAYHQGTVWPWLSGAFVDAWLYVHGAQADSCVQARQRFLAPLLAHLDTAGLGHVSEIADGDAPHQPRGCPFQAWSLGELIRIERMLNGPQAHAADRADQSHQSDQSHQPNQPGALALPGAPPSIGPP